jgi:hypothetical protein
VRALTVPVAMAVCTAALASCGAGLGRAAGSTPGGQGHASASAARHQAAASPALPAPAALAPLAGSAAGQGEWHPVGRTVRGYRVVYETRLLPPGGRKPAGLAWMDTRLLAARLYSGSISPGGGPYQFSAPIQAAQAASLVAAFNGGFKMRDARGGYYTDGRVIDRLRPGAASLVISADGSVNLGASCAASVPGIKHQWRSGLGITANGALVYAAGPALDPLQLAGLLVRAGAVRAMQLDINPNWPVFVSFDPRTPAGLASPANGSKLLASTAQGPATFFQSAWARDFITMSAAPAVPAISGPGPAK